ncbi:MAG TPA: biotin--[acetyl-CoA-carboxylase] ligase [Ohtaekwangia sp.]|nr:biotin--[acetyl-CoA-carboxylase] ligase [Ohtaekwangia sp.]
MYKIPAKTLFLGKNLIFVPQCHSTNDLALRHCQENDWLEGTVIITDNQTAGRGQRGNSWLTEPAKNLTFSFMIRPSFLTVKEQFYLTIFVSLGIYDYVTEKTDKKVHIKWPNDILVDDRKICGVLIENQLSGNRLETTVIGIGLNINQQQFDAGTPTSLSMITHQRYLLSDELNLLLQKLERRYLQLKERKLDRLKDDYLNALYRIGEDHTFVIAAGEAKGRITGIDELGRLSVMFDEQRKSFDVKEIKFV